MGICPLEPFSLVGSKALPGSLVCCEEDGGQESWEGAYLENHFSLSMRTRWCKVVVVIMSSLHVASGRRWLTIIASCLQRQLAGSRRLYGESRGIGWKTHGFVFSWKTRSAFRYGSSVSCQLLLSCALMPSCCVRVRMASSQTWSV